MNGKLKKTAAFLLALALLAPLQPGVYSDSEDTGEAAAEETVEEESSEGEEKEDKKKKKDEDEVPRTEDEAFALMKKVASSGDLNLYTNEKEGTLCLEDTKSGKKWFSNPVDLQTSNAKKSQKDELKSGMTLIYAEPYNRSTTTQTSGAKGKFKMKEINNGVEITYTFNTPGIKIPVQITLEDGYMKLYVNTSEIVEEHPSSIDGQLVSDLAFFTTFGAAGLEDKGYFVIPDGSGAVIDFNNGKTDLRTYSGKVYGRDITAVKQQKTYTSRNVSLPMYGIIKDNAGLMVVADKGDSCASINSYVSNQNKTDYNSTYFDFELRTNDEYLMGGESNPLRVFEKRGILVPEIEIRYYPVSGDDNVVDYTDIADKYREYLIKDKGVEDKAIPETSPLYLDLYGGTLEKKSVLGIPVTVKQPVTTYPVAQYMLEVLKNNGVDDMVVTYNKFSNQDIGEQITDSFAPAGKLGGNSKWKKLKSYADSNNIALFPAVDNTLYKSGNGYWTMTNTAIRVSNAYSRIPVYDLAHGVENKYYRPLSLFSPASYNKAFTKLIDSYAKKGVTNYSFGSLANTIYGDYGRAATSRDKAESIIADIYARAKQNGQVLSDNASAYVLPYSDYITNVPVDSSKYDVFDYDIPFYQMVLHGVTPYSSIAVNSEADLTRIVLDSISGGANLSFDFVGIEADELKDTKLDRYYYAYYANWISEAKGLSALAKEVLSPAADQYIDEYRMEDDRNIVTTVYKNGYTTVVNYEEGTIEANGKVYKVSDYLEEEVN
ncbi:MAG: hypothetical protein J6F31_06425 [Oscillospiraceae bacterium]|nr:hypothetical protein [Oscillospiraceae bacterium]